MSYSWRIHVCELEFIFVEKINLFKMSLPNDVYGYLTNFADDKDILNMLSVNKKFNDDVFFIELC